MQKYAQELNRSLFSRQLQRASQVDNFRVKWRRGAAESLEKCKTHRETWCRGRIWRGWAGGLHFFGLRHECSRRAGLPRTESLLGLFKSLIAMRWCKLNKLAPKAIVMLCWLCESAARSGVEILCRTREEPCAWLCAEKGGEGALARSRRRLWQ